MQSVTTLIKAGALAGRFENGALRAIRYGRLEVIRNLYFSLRDQDWGTVPYRIEQFQETSTDSGFQIRFRAVHSVDNEDVFHWDVHIEGTPHSQITFVIEGKVLQPFWRNRAGFCILHPIEECAGKSVTIIQPDGSSVEAVFPKLISPESPFPCIRAMQWDIEPGVTAHLQVDGDDFETEDQRNWTDTSYKTFCTPLARPFPVELLPGDTIRQEIRLSLAGANVQTAALSQSNNLTITLQDERTPFPRIGTQQAFGRAPLTEAALEQLRTLHLDHYRVELDLSEPNWQGLLREGYRQAQGIGAGLFVALTFGYDPAEQARAFIEEVRTASLSVTDIVLFRQRTYATPTDLIETVVPILRAGLPSNVRIGAGTQTNFTELGRNLFMPEGLAFVSYSIQPQEHAFDHASLVENIEAQGDTVRSAQALYPHQVVYVSPLTLRRRFNPYAKNVPNHFVEQPLPEQADARQGSPFGAAWLLGSLKTLAEAGVDAVTVFRTTGDLGILSVEGHPYPAFDLLKHLQSFRDGTIRRTRSSDKLVCSSLLIEKDADRCLIVANHTDEPQTVSIDGFSQKFTLTGHESKVIHNPS